MIGWLSFKAAATAKQRIVVKPRNGKRERDALGELRGDRAEDAAAEK
jgi:hypothetical protein